MRFLCCLTPFVSRNCRLTSTIDCPPPMHHKTPGICNRGYSRCLQIFFGSISINSSASSAEKDYSHSFLRFRNGQFGTIQSIILQRHFCQAEYQLRLSVPPMATEIPPAPKIVASFNKSRCLFPAEKTLNFSFCKGISLLHFRTAGFKGLGMKLFG